MNRPSHVWDNLFVWSNLPPAEHEPAPHITKRKGTSVPGGWTRNAAEPDMEFENADIVRVGHHDIIFAVTVHVPSRHAVADFTEIIATCARDPISGTTARA